MAGPDDLLRWAGDLTRIARDGLARSASLYERERFEEVGRIAGDMRAAAVLGRGSGAPAVGLVDGLPAGPPPRGPQVAAGALVANEAGELLLVQRADSGAWLFPAGLADIGYSPAEVAVKETAEETGIGVEPVSVAALFDAGRFGYPGLSLYVIVFACRMRGGDLRPHPLETAAVGFFARDRLPHPLVGDGAWVDLAFTAVAGHHTRCAFH